MAVRVGRVIFPFRLYEAKRAESSRVELSRRVRPDNYNQSEGVWIRAGLAVDRWGHSGLVQLNEREGGKLRVVSRRRDRGWTEHLHHLIYDPLCCTDNAHQGRASMCEGTRTHGQNKFAYACNGAADPLQPGKERQRGFLRGRSGAERRCFPCNWNRRG